MLDLQSKHSLETTYQKTTLYRYVFESKLIKLAVLLLYGFFILQPASSAYAFIEDTTQSDMVETIVPTVIDDFVEVVETASVTHPDLQNTQVNEESAELTVSDTSLQSEPALETVSFQYATTSETVLTTVVTDSTVRTETNAPGDTLTISSSSTPVSPTTTIPTGVSDHEAVTPSADPVPILKNTSSSSALTVSATTSDLSVSEHTSSAFNFTTQDCAIVGDGAYYCSSPKLNTDVLKDAVFSAPDADGDLEIYVRLNGEERVITSNTVDDAAPYYDSLSERIVWHSLENDRYQIVSYDTKTNKHTVLTHASYNNMEPVAYGTITLWQAWIDNNWEIMMFDGTTVTQITHNQMQDVSPHMRGGYIVWQSQFTTGWQVAVYDQKSNSVEYIPSEEGVKVENPRFVLVYDSTNDQGDIQTVGYDFDNKTSFMLGSLPSDVPDKLPSPDQTGETRALIQSKQSLKEVEVVDATVITGGAGTVHGSSTARSTPSLFGTLEISQASSSQAAVASSSLTVLQIEDVVVPPYAVVATISQNATFVISDLVIPPLATTTLP